MCSKCSKFFCVNPSVCLYLMFVRLVCLCIFARLAEMGSWIFFSLRRIFSQLFTRKSALFDTREWHSPQRNTHRSVHLTRWCHPTWNVPWRGGGGAPNIFRRLILEQAAVHRTAMSLSVQWHTIMLGQISPTQCFKYILYVNKWLPQMYVSHLKPNEQVHWRNKTLSSPGSPSDMTRHCSRST